MITLTDAAARQIQSLIAEKGDGSKGLRLFVEKGGCAGMQYGMNLDVPKEGDQIFANGDVSIIVDPESLQYLEGTEVDYSDDLMSMGFRLKNPKAVRSCGCGTSFDTTPEPEAAAH